MIGRVPLVCGVLSLALLFGCGGDDGPSVSTPTMSTSAMSTPTPQGSTVVEQGTVATFTELRAGVISVSPGTAPATGGSALLSLSIQSPGTLVPARTVSLAVGEAMVVEGGTLRLLETIKGTGGHRDAVRLQFEPAR